MANRDLRFRFAAKVDTTWGNRHLHRGQPPGRHQVYQAYLMFKWPDTDIQVNAGLQPLSFPQSSIYNDSLMFADFASALTIEGKIVPGTLGYLIRLRRMLDANQTYDNAQQVGDELDLYFLTLPVSLNGFKATRGPWWAWPASTPTTSRPTPRRSPTPPTPTTCSRPAPCSPPAATGRTTRCPMSGPAAPSRCPPLDPFRFYADVIFGSGAFNDRASSMRQGWMIDAAAEYNTGWNVLRPQVFAWWASGEDGSTRNGSERLPHMRTTGDRQLLPVRRRPDLRPQRRNGHRNPPAPWVSPCPWTRCRSWRSSPTA